jgi:hypothetical protein
VPQHTYHARKAKDAALFALPEVESGHAGHGEQSAQQHDDRDRIVRPANLISDCGSAVALWGQEVAGSGLRGPNDEGHGRDLVKNSSRHLDPFVAAPRPPAALPQGPKRGNHASAPGRSLHQVPRIGGGVCRLGEPRASRRA